MPTLKTDLAMALPDLSKAVFSQPTAAARWTKLSIRPVKLKGRLAFQTEGIRDNKAYHQNLDEQALLRLFDEELDGRYRQVLITTGSEASQYVLKRDGSYKRSARALAARLPPPGQQCRKTSRRITTGRRATFCLRGKTSRRWWTWGCSPRIFAL